jgi:CheY-like chemotaxis protein
MDALADLRILIVEDEFLIAFMLTEMLIGARASVVGPARTKDQALMLAQSERLDGALLDVNLKGERSYAVAAELKRRGIPFVLVTGYGEAHDACTDAPIVCKPFTEDRLLLTLAKTIAAGARSATTPQPVLPAITTPTSDDSPKLASTKPAKMDA